MIISLTFSAISTWKTGSNHHQSKSDWSPVNKKAMVEIVPRPARCDS